MNGHLFSLAEVVLVSSELVCHVVDGVASPHECACLTILRENQVLELKCGAGSNRGSLLSSAGHVERDPALSLRLVESEIDLVNLDHFLENLDQSVFINYVLVLFVHNFAIFVKHSEALELLLSLVFELHLVCERVVEHVEVNLVHGTE